jgi:hypothetical protein
MLIKIQNNRDTGGVHLGNVQAKVGDKLVIVSGELVQGAHKERRISYVQPTRTGALVAFTRGFGSFPLGDFEVEWIPQDTK